MTVEKAQQSSAVKLSYQPERYEIAEANLLIATGLPGAEALETTNLLAKLDAWTRYVAARIGELTPRFRRSPNEFNHSYSRFQVLVMITVVQRELGVHYDPELMSDPVDWSDSRGAFIHGLLTGFGGTCASMPVLYVAIGRRLGFPLFLVGAKGHLFTRWAGEDETFNIEGTNRGLSCHEDAYYQHWPNRISKEELARGWFLEPLSQAEEFASFLAQRGHCLGDNLRLWEAVKCYHDASILAPENPNHRGCHAVATVMYNACNGLARYDIAPGDDEVLRVIDRHGTRIPEPWEQQAAPIAKTEYERILYSRRRSAGNDERDQALAQMVLF